MSKHEHDRHHNHSGGKRGVHKDWRAWVAVVLMLAAIVVYVLTMDESLTPEGNDQGAVPAAAE